MSRLTPTVSYSRASLKKSPSVWTLIGVWSYRFRYVLLFLSCSIALWLILRQMIVHTLYAPVNTIRSVLVDPVSALQVNNQSLFDSLQKILSGRNITDVSRREYNDTLLRMQAIEPFIQSFKIQKQSDYTVVLTLHRRQPSLIIRQQDIRMAWAKDSMIVLSTGDALGSGVVMVSLPVYMSGHTLGSGLFFYTSLSKLVDQLSLIQQNIPEYHNIIRIPASHRVAVSLPNKSLVWFSLGSKLEEQLRRYKVLYSYYPAIQQMNSVDMSSQETIIVR